MLTVGSLFSGVGGLDLGLERAGMKVLWQCENNKFSVEVLRRNWSGVHFEPIEDFIPPERVDVLAGGDPCPSRSIARGGRPSRHPDLAGYFLALVGRLRPRWVVRENVRASNVTDFTVGLELLRYRAFVIELDGRDFTGQSRRRQFCIGCPANRAAAFGRVVFDAADGFGFSASSQGEETPIAACLTAHPARMAAEDTYCYESGRGLRLLDCEEAEALMGFDRGWTRGFSRSRRRIMLGNAVIVDQAEWIGRRIVEADQCES